jgi:hypothetical protein
MHWARVAALLLLLSAPAASFTGRTSPEELWWSFRPLARPAVPAVRESNWVRNPIDAFVLARLEAMGLTYSPPADRATLVRRLYFDLLGLPPAPQAVDAFCHDPDSDDVAWGKLVDRLLGSPHYGERWARHWLDVVHYGDTHGYDKDKLRPNAWPYRDYVIRSCNEDKPYARFVAEQLAGDMLAPNTRDGIVALGFLAAGPWDFVGHVELREGTLDKQITRNLDRDDIVATTLNTFTSLTVQCARCHDHKFDPISQDDYYSLQAVFAAVDRADRPYDPDPQVARRRAELLRRRADLAEKRQALEARIQAAASPALAAVERRIHELRSASPAPARAEFGYHSQIEPRQLVTKWLQLDLGQSTPIAHIVYVGCHDTFNNIGAGFGFPVRYKIELSDDAEFRGGVFTVLDHTDADVANPGVEPQGAAAGGQRARYVRVTATKLAPRSGDYIFALAELSVLAPDGRNAAARATVTALDSIEASPRWRKSNVVDGYYFGASPADRLPELAKLLAQRHALRAESLDEPTRQARAELEQACRDADAQLAALPPPSLVYAAATQFPPSGNFTASGGTPRPIHVLLRGSEKSPKHEVGPGTVSCVPPLPSRFVLGPQHAEGDRRAVLARWITDANNPLTWRSIVNRVWQYHFGRGIVETPNDFGRMGALPTHPELLDWLAVEFRDGGQLLKRLHRLILTSATYRQSSAHHDAGARIDSGNQLLWRMNRQRLDAEALRDAVLVASGKWDPRPYGPGFQPFGFQDDHSPHYKYEEYNPDDPTSHRRSIYRFLVRSVPDPFMEALDCADPSQTVAKRNETLTALQALALLNNPFMVKMSENFADRVARQERDLASQLSAAYRLALGRPPNPDELAVLGDVARRHGLPTACRLIFNMNEFAFLD